MRERIDTDQVNGIGGALSDSTIDGLYIQHTKVGLWFDGPMNNLDGHEQHHRRPDRRRAQLPHRRHQLGRVEQLRPQHRRRRPGHVVGDDRRTPATRSTTTRCRRRRSPTASRSTAAPTTRSSNNLVADPIREGSGIQVGSRFGAEPFTGHLLDHRQHHGPGRHLRAELEHRARRDLVLRAREEHRRGHPGGRRPLPRQHLQRDHAGRRLAGEGPLLDHQRPLQGHPRRRHRHLGAQRPGRRVRDVRERGRPQRRCRRHQQLRLVPLHRRPGPSSSSIDLGGNDGGGTTGPVVRRRGSCRTPSPATTARRSSRPRRRRPGDRQDHRRGCGEGGGVPAGYRAPPFPAARPATALRRDDRPPVRRDVGPSRACRRRSQAPRRPAGSASGCVVQVERDEQRVVPVAHLVDERRVGELDLRGPRPVQPRVATAQADQLLVQPQDGVRRRRRDRRRRAPGRTASSPPSRSSLTPVNPSSSPA